MKSKNSNILKEYPNLIILFNCVIISIILSTYEPFRNFINHLGNFSYLGAFIGGILFVNTFTASLSIVILFALLHDLPLFTLSLCAGLGAMVGDFLIFRFIKNNIFSEIKALMIHLGFKHSSAREFIHSKFASWTLPLLGALIIASPFPDELGVMLMGLSRINTYKFLLLAFVLNSLGIMAILGLFDSVF